MADIKISINAPSYKRSGKVETLDYIPDCKIWVDEGEFDEYKKNNPKGNIIPCKKGIQGNLCRIRNHIIDIEYKKGFNAVLIIDDDLQYLGYFEKNSKSQGIKG